MKQLSALLLMLLTISCSAWMYVDVPAEKNQGEVVRFLFISDKKIDDSSLVLFYGDKQLQKTKLFFVVSEKSKNAYAALIGLPSDIEPGNYRLFFEALNKKKVFVSMEKNLEIKEVNFRSEDIRLNSAMSSLRQDTTERRFEEARELNELLASFNPEAVYFYGRHIVPTEARWISSFYGDRRQYLYSNGTKAKSIHFGIDYAASVGTPVYASGSGKLVMAKDRLITGYTAVIEHLPGVYSLYYHLDMLAVPAGSYVEQGQLIAYAGKTGLATGAHLHWEIRAGSAAVNPDQFTSAELIDKKNISDIINTAKTIKQGR